MFVINVSTFLSHIRKYIIYCILVTKFDWSVCNIIITFKIKMKISASYLYLKIKYSHNHKGSRGVQPFPSLVMMVYIFFTYHYSLSTIKSRDTILK